MFTCIACSHAPGGRALNQPDLRSRLERRRAKPLRELAHVGRERSAGGAAPEVPLEQQRLMDRQLVVEL